MNAIIACLEAIDWMFYIAIASIAINFYLHFKITHLRWLARGIEDYAGRARLQLGDSERRFRESIQHMARLISGGSK